MTTAKREWKEDLRWNGTRICANCIHARDLTFEEYQKFGKGRGEYDRPNCYCEHPRNREGRHPHPTQTSSHCFGHEYDDESVLMPKNPKYVCEGVVDLWPYEKERAEALRRKAAQVKIEDVKTDKSANVRAFE